MAEIISITFCAPGQLRMREVVNRSNARPTSKFASVKADRIIQANSEGELSVIHMTECNPSIVRIEEQPCEILYWDGENERRHIPDLRVFIDNGTKEIWEIKRRADITSEVEWRTNFMDAALPQYGYSYRLVVAEEAETQPAKRNRSVVTYFSHRPVSLYEREIIRRLCDRTGSIGWGEAYDGSFGPFGREILCRLVIEGVLTLDLDKPLLLTTRFYPRKGVL